MLASALDSHPQIQCRGEYGMVEKFPIGRTEKGVKGCIVQGYHILRQLALPAGWPVAKIIRLTRPLDEIARSMHYSTADGQSYEQHLSPVQRTMAVSKPTTATIRRLEAEEYAVTDWLRIRNFLPVRYDLLCGGKDARAIRWEQAHRICEYLEVQRRPLIPVTHKPSPL